MPIITDSLTGDWIKVNGVDNPESLTDDEIFGSGGLFEQAKAAGKLHPKTESQPNGESWLQKTRNEIWSPEFPSHVATGVKIGAKKTGGFLAGIPESFAEFEASKNESLGFPKMAAAERARTKEQFLPAHIQYDVTDADKAEMQKAGLTGETAEMFTELLGKLPVYVAAGGGGVAAARPILARIGLPVLQKQLPTVFRIFGPKAVEFLQEATGNAIGFGALGGYEGATEPVEEGGSRLANTLNAIGVGGATGPFYAMGGTVGKMVSEGLTKGMTKGLVSKAVDIAARGAGAGAGGATATAAAGGSPKDIIMSGVALGAMGAAHAAFPKRQGVLEPGPGVAEETAGAGKTEEQNQRKGNEPTLLRLTPKDLENGKQIADELGLDYVGEMPGFGGDETMPAQHTFQIRDENGQKGTSFTAPVGMTSEQVAVMRDWAKERVFGPEVVVDAVTKLPNSNTIRLQMENSLSLDKPIKVGVGRMGGEEFAVISDYGTKRDQTIVDIDNFKAVNDLYGHSEGDRILGELGDLANKMLGDPKQNTIERLGQFLKQVPETIKTSDGQPITVSMGTAEGMIKDAKGNPKWKADDLLYRSKENGRNQLTVDNGTETGYIKRGPETGEKAYVTKFYDKQGATALQYTLEHNKGTLSAEDIASIERVRAVLSRRAGLQTGEGDTGEKRPGIPAVPGPEPVAPPPGPVPTNRPRAQLPGESADEYDLYLDAWARYKTDTQQRQGAATEAEIAAEDKRRVYATEGVALPEHAAKKIETLRKNLSKQFPQDKDWLENGTGNPSMELSARLSDMTEDHNSYPEKKADFIKNYGLDPLSEDGTLGANAIENMLGQKIRATPKAGYKAPPKRVRGPSGSAEGQVPPPSKKIRAYQIDIFGNEVPVTEAPAEKPKRTVAQKEDPTAGLDMWTEEGRGIVQQTAMSFKAEEGPGKAPGSEAEVGATEANLTGAEATYAQRKAVRLPFAEGVEFARLLASDKSPKVRRALRKAQGRALGVFKHGKGDPGIELRADIAIGPVVAEIPAKSGPEGDIAARPYIDAMVESGIPEKQITTRWDSKTKTTRVYKIDANYKDKVLWHEVGHFTDFIKKLLEQGTLKRGNILGHVASLFDYWQHTIDSVPTTRSQTLTGRERRQIGEDAKRRLGKLASSAEVSKEKARRIAEVIKSRKLVTRDELTAEAKTWTRYWNPWKEDQATPEYNKYRDSAKELYAEAFSGMMVDPGKFQEIAPTYFQTFMNHLESKPEIQAKYDELQARVQGVSGSEYEATKAKQLAGYRKGDEARRIAWENQRNQRQLTVDKVWKSMRKMLYNKAVQMGTYTKWKRKAGDKTADEGRDAYEKLLYRDAPAFQYNRSNETEVQDVLEKAGISLDEYNMFVENRRLAHEYALKFGPGGVSGNRAEEQLDGMKKELGEEKWKVMNQAADNHWEIRKAQVIPLCLESEQYGEALDKTLVENREYVKFSNVEAAYNEAYKGAQIGVPGVIKKAFGMLAETERPYEMTVLGDLALQHAALRAITIKKFYQHFKDIPGAAKLSETRNGEIVENHDPRWQTVTVLHKGKVVGYDFDPDLADLVDKGNRETEVFALVCAAISRPFKSLVVTYNPGWLIRNPIRDVNSTAINIPGANIAEAYKFFLGARADAVLDVLHNTSTPDVEKLYRGGALITGRIFKATDQENADTELERIQATYVGLSEGKYRRKVRSPIEHTLAALAAANDMVGPERINIEGKIAERQSKIGGYRYLKKLHPDWSDEKCFHAVRKYIGTPDARAGGTIRMLINNICLFSNINMQGILGSLEAMKLDTKGWWGKQVAYNLGPKTLLRAIRQTGLPAAAAGAAYATLKWLKDWEENLSDYHETNFHPVPLGMTKSGKSVALLVPPDFQGQAISAVAWQASGYFDLLGENPEGKTALGVTGKTLLTAGKMLPGANLNPLLTSAMVWGLYAGGNNPPDAYRMKPVIDDLSFKAHEGLGDMLEYTYNTMGGSALPIPKQLVRKALGMIPGVTFQGESEREVINEFGKVFGYDIPYLHSLILVTDAGKTEKRRAIGATAGLDVAKTSFAKHQDVYKEINKLKENPAKSQEGFNKSISAFNELYFQLKDEARAKGEKVDRSGLRAIWNAALVAKFGDKDIIGIYKAQSKKERRVLIDEALKDSAELTQEKKEKLRISLMHRNILVR